jgi:hypothetical protein
MDGPSAMGGIIRAGRRLEHRVRCQYLRRVPPPLLARIDPGVRAMAGLARRALAAALYTYQPLGLWSGACDGRTTTVAIWGGPGDARPWLDLLFDEPPAVRWLDRCSYRAAGARAAALAATADLLVATTTPALSAGFRRRGFLIAPATARLAGRPAALLAYQRTAGESLRSDLRRIERSGYRSEIWPYSRERSALFYDRYLVPHARLRFSDGAAVPDFDWIDRSFGAGCALVALPPGGDEPDAMVVVVERGDVLWVAHLGTRNAAATRGTGGVAALYAFAIRLAHQRGMRLIDLGRSRPWLRDGVTRFKWKWGFRPVVDPAEALEYAVRVLRDDGPAAHRLAGSRLIVRSGRCFSIRSASGLVATAVP